MSIKKISISQIGSIICDNIKNPDVVFVFSTDIDMTSWAEWVITNFQQTGVKTVSLDRFMAWDDFKRQFVVASEKDKHSIPSLLRKVFVYNLIAQNAQEAEKGNPLFKSIINPAFASDGYSFADWISGNIPALKIWHDRFEKLCIENPEIIDEEDKDYQLLYEKYVEFLGTEMFEPSWITPDFSAVNKTFMIFFPEQFSDYEEYKPVLENIPSVILYEMEENEEKPVVYKYDDARKELRHAVLYIRNLVENSNGNIKYNQVALHAPKLKNYLPYVEREFKKYCVPYVVRAGNSYTVNNAGSVFLNIQACKNENFSFAAVRSLLLNSFIPWSDKRLNETVVRLGSDYHCICNYEAGRDKDIWIKALKRDSHDYREREFYECLRKNVECLCDAASFEAIKKAWNGFKQAFLVDDEFSQEANNILSSCIVLLDELIKLEKDFITPRNLAVYKPYDFFVNELNNKTYTPQQKQIGVNIFDYKVAACGAFKYNYVINCNQNAITVSNKQLSFLNNQKRAALGIKDEDSATPVYISLYKKFDTPEQINTIYTYSENSFDGFAIPHNYFEVREECVSDKLDDSDFIKAEKNWFINNQSIPVAISENQKKEYEVWKQTADYSKVIKEEYSADGKIKEAVDYLMNEKRSKDGDSYIKITQTDLKNFFPCARFWLLKSVLKLKEDSIDATLIDPYAKGNISHKTMDLLFKELKDLGGKIPVCFDGSFGENQTLVEELVKKCVNKAIDENHDYTQSPLTYEVLNSQKYRFVEIIMSFLYRFCQADNSKSFGGYTIVDTEKWFASRENNKDYGLGGAIDCILCDDDGNVAIVDYKSNKVPTFDAATADPETEILEDFQCAVYITLFNRQQDNSVNVSRMIFSSIQKNEANLIVDEVFPKKGKTKTPEEYEPTLAVLKKYVDVFAEKIKNGDFKPKADPDAKYDNVNVYKNCLKCNFKSICRSTFTVAGHNL